MKPVPCRLRGEVRDKIHGAKQAEGQAGGEGATGAGETDPLWEQEDQQAPLRVGLGFRL
jgi:hypothetical protein